MNLASFLPNVAQAVAFLLLIRDARLGQAQGVSKQTLYGLAVSGSFGLLNLPEGELVYSAGIIAVIIIGWVCSIAVDKATDVGTMDDLIIRHTVPRWARWAVVYAAAAAMSTFAVLFACHLSLTEVYAWALDLPTGIICTYQNFLHGTALLPQLVVSRQQGCVAPAAAKFLFITGTKHLVELAADASVSYDHYAGGSLNLHEASYMSGDLFAAILLMDFLYLFVKSKTIKDMKGMSMKAWVLPLDV